MMRDIYAPEYEGNSTDVLYYRDRLPKRPSIGFLEDCPDLFMPLLYEVAQFCEADEPVPANGWHRKMKNFTLLPMKAGFECSHLKICKTALYGLLKRAGMRVGRIEDFRANAEKMWKRLFKLEDFETANRKFAGEILTDGKAVCIVMRKPRRTGQPPPLLPPSDGSEIWGLDPGRRDIFVATSNQGALKSCSTKRFYNEAKYTATNEWIKRLYANSPEGKIVADTPKKKTASLPVLDTVHPAPSSHHDPLPHGERFQELEIQEIHGCTACAREALQGFHVFQWKANHRGLR